MRHPATNHKISGYRNYFSILPLNLIPEHGPPSHWIKLRPKYTFTPSHSIVFLSSHIIMPSSIAASRPSSAGRY